MQQPSPLRTTSRSVIYQKAFANNNGVPFAALYDLHASNVPQVHRSANPPRCRGCRAFWSRYCMINLPKQMWHCACCGVGNISKAALENEDPSTYPELHNDTVEYRVFHHDKDRPAYPLKPTKHIVIAIDATMDAPLLANLKSALLQTFQDIEPETLVSVVVFDSTVAVYDLGGSGQSAAATIVPGGVPLDQASRDVLQQPGFRVAHGKCMHRLASVLSSIRPFETDKPMRLRARCLTVAIQAGLALLSMSAPGPQSEAQMLAPGSHLLVFTGGPITKGPGLLPLAVVDGIENPSKAQKQSKEEKALMGSLADTAARLGVGLHVFLGAEPSVNVPLLSHLAHSSQGGQLHLQCGFGPSFAPALKACLTSCFGTHAALDAFCSEGVRLCQWIGVDDEQIQSASPPGLFLSTSACCIGNVVAGKGIVARFNLTSDLPASTEELPSYVHLQLVLYYHDLRTSELVAQVSSTRLSVVSRLSQFLPSVDVSTAAIVAAKRIVLEANSSDALSSLKKLEVLRLGVGAQASLIAARLGKDIQVSSGLLGLGARKEKQWPQELLPLARGLYNLQSSRMLASSGLPVITPDERRLLMQHLFGGDYAAVLPQVLPALYAVLAEQQGPASPSPNLTLLDLKAPLDLFGMAALQASQPNGQTTTPQHTPPLVLDTGATIQILSPPGQQQRQQQATQLVLAHTTASSGRTPQLLYVRQGEEESAMQGNSSSCVSEAEFLAALQPVHQDAYQLQKQELERLSNSCGVLRIGDDEGHVRALSAAVAERLQSSGLVCAPSLLQWAKGLSIMLYH